ncbi:MAG TPA: AI-2E family transporter [Pirellulales bacterium]|nr:AI-2E family transporter [Pirellulales bacterium]
MPTHNAAHDPGRIALVVAVVAALGGVLLWLAADTLLLIFAGILFAVFLSGLTELVSRYTRLPRGWALAVVSLVLIVLFALAGWLMAARLAEQAQQFSEELPRAVKHLRERLDEYPWGKWLAAELKDIRLSAEERESALSKAATAASAALEGVTGAVVILFIGLFVAADPELYKRGLVRLAPIARRPRARQVVDGMGDALWRWMLGRLLAMAAVGVCATIGFALIGMPLALILGLFAGLVNFVPNLGPLIWLAPAMLLALTQGGSQAVAVGILFVVVQTAEGYLLTPLVQQRMIHLAPAVTIIVQVLMGAIFGFAGVALATPLAAAVLVLVRMLYIEDCLGDRERT